MVAYSLAIFTGAFLLFQVQPLVAKYLLPWFGGAPAVWTACMLVFQALLLGGYLYAHLSRQFLPLRRQMLLHLVLLGVAIFMLPIVPNESWKPTDPAAPTLRIVALLVASLGLPYVVLAATAPLLQHWFTRSHPAQTPFRLYALSNAGSLLALLTYPALFETLLSRSAQADAWSVGLALHALATAAVAWRNWNVHPASALAVVAEGSAPRPTAGQRVGWVLLPACAVILLLAVTNKACQEVAVVPLLWILPLALYLLSFIVCFERPGWYDRRWFAPALALALSVLALLATAQSSLPIPVQILALNASLLVVCLVCHGEVYRLKPDPAGLTSFYLAIAFGGALGGFCVAVIAPAVFPDYFELPCGVLLCGGLFLWVTARAVRPLLRAAPAPLAWVGGLALLGVLAVVVWNDSRRFSSVRVYQARNFYGVLKVLRHENRDPTFSLAELLHGQVAHGMQFLHPSRAEQPTLYYSEESGVGRVFGLLTGTPRHVGIVGLGIGTLATYSRAGDRFRCYEINPLVERAARTHFSFLRDAAAETAVVLGDARLQLEREPAQGFDLLVLDAFSSDAIPLHLLTREAFATYLRHLQPSGLIAAHISNRSVNLEPVLDTLARHLGLVAAVVEHRPPADQWWIIPSTWVVLSRDAARFNEPTLRSVARPLASPHGGLKLWTDDYAALVPVLRWKEFVGAAPPDAEASARAGANLAKLGDVPAAITRFREAVRLNPNSPEALNNLACLLATAPDPALRDGAEAVRHAERACELTDYRHPILLSTLAAAYAQAGRFAEAGAMAEKTCQLAELQGDQELVARNRHFQQLYTNRQVYPYPAK